MDEDAHSTGIFQQKKESIMKRKHFTKIGSRRGCQQGKKKEESNQRKDSQVLAPIEEKKDDPLEEEDLEDKKKEDSYTPLDIVYKK